MFRVHRLRSLLALLLVAGALCLPPVALAQPAPQVCDCDADGDIDKVDINLIANARGQAASGPTDPRDPSSATITITPVDDAAVENPPETVTLTITANAAYVVATPPQNTASITIADNDSAATQP